MITVIDLKTSNINSVSRALKYLGVKHRISDNAAEIRKSDKLIFPGVGSFAEAVKRMNTLCIDDTLKEMALREKIPMLGICLGMQLFATCGEEGGFTRGLDLIKGKVIYHRASLFNLRLPHIGWNEVNHNHMKLFESVENNACFYFVHSYEFVPEEPVQLGYTNYGVDFVSVVQKGNIIGIQFHLEKSQKAGLRVLENFCNGIF